MLDRFHNSITVKPVVASVGALPPIQVGETLDQVMAYAVPSSIIRVTLWPSANEDAVGVLFAPSVQVWIPPLAGLMSTLPPSVMAKTVSLMAGAFTLPVPLVGPRRLRPSRDYQVCGYKAHGSHQLGHFRGRVWCYACASSFAVTSARLPEAILGACAERIEEDTARRNLAFLVAGGLPSSWREEGWPKGADFGFVGFA